MRRFIPLLFLLFNCVYYNTFYNAEKYYSEGLKQKKEGKSGSSFFQKSVEKCKKVITRYSGSGWMDDAIFLLGKNYYYLNQLPLAKVNFKKIIEHYYSSPYNSESMLYLGRIAMEEGRMTESVIFLDRAVDSEDLNIRMEAFKARLEMHLRMGSPEEAIEAGKDFMAKYGTHKAEVYYIMGDAYSKIGDYYRALEMYKKSMKEGKGLEVEGLKYKLASLYMELDSLEQALSIIGEYKKNDSLTVLKGKLLRRVGRYEEAEEALKFAKNWRNRLGAIANYELGLLKESQGDLKEAEELYSKAANFGDFHEITKLARAKSDIIKMLTELHPDSTTTDSTGCRKDPAYLYFRIGELYYLEIGDPVKAVESYKEVFNSYPESQYAPKALYVLLFIYSNELKDSSGVSEFLSTLKGYYPDTEFSRKAMEEFGGYLPDTTGNRE